MLNVFFIVVHALSSTQWILWDSKNPWQHRRKGSICSHCCIRASVSDLCLSPIVECFLDPTFSTSWHHLKKWIYEDDLTLFGISLGSHLWDFVNKSPEHNKSFNETMASDSQMMNLVLRDCNWVLEGLESIVDVGGGTGITVKITC